MLTPGYAMTATERVLPRLALDFTTGVLDPRVTVTRALNTATRINSSGFLEGVNADLPRFDYDPATLAPKGLLIEEARTNLITQSRDYSTAAWGKTAITVSACPDPSPSGLTDAQTITNSGGVGLLTFVHIGTAGVPYTFSVWMRRRTGTGTVAITDTNGVYVPQTLTSSWKRFTVTTSTPSTTTIRAYIRVYTTGDEVDIYNSQLELGAFGTSDIYTAGSTVTRNADRVSMTGTNFSDWYNASEGAFYAETSGSPSTGSIYSVDGGTTGTRMLAQYNSPGTNTLFRIVDSTDQVSLTQNGVVTAGGICKIVSAYKQDSFATSTNAAATSTDTAGTVPTVDNLKLGRNVLNAAYMTAHFRKFMYWPQRITNAEVQSFSK